MNKLFIPLLFALFLITGCENNDFMQSESTVRGKLQGSWKMHGSTLQDTKETWKMDNGTLTITRYSGEDTITDRGLYTVLTKFSKIYVTFSGLTEDKFSPWELNTRWNIAALTGSVLYISTKNQGGAIISREFVKQ